MIDVRVLDIRPHPDQATHNPGTWAVQFRVEHAGRNRSFWRWYSVRAPYRCDPHRAEELKKKPSHAEILKDFWANTFAELHGFSFDKDDP